MQILELFFVSSFAVILLYYLFLFSRFAFLKGEKTSPNSLGISIIICAKNEVDNLSLFLPLILNQNYKKFEIVLVNDHSNDGTLKVMLDFKKKNTNIQVLNLNDSPYFNGNKKNALTQGIKLAKYEHILLTDADCKPISISWISEMSAHFTLKKSIILGYGSYKKIKKSLLNKIIRFETLTTAIQYFSYAKSGLTYMGVGRNMAYTKSEFINANGFIEHQHIKSGDDDLLINQIATKNNVSCCYTKNSFTVSEPHTNFKKWFYQKRRHISTANSYKPIHQFLLGLYYISLMVFWMIGIFLLATNFTSYIALLFLIRIVLLYIIFGFSSKKLNEGDLLFYLPFLELFLIIIQLRIFIANLIKKPTRW